MERLKKAHAEALAGKQLEMKKLKESMVGPSLNEQISQLKEEHSDAL